MTGVMRGWVLTGLIATVLLPAVAVAQVYRWVDDQDVIHYTTGLESVPERYRPGARALSGSSGGSSSAEALPAPSPVEPRAASRPGAVSIPFSPGLPILVAAQINGVGPVTLVLDTGAERTMVSPEALAQLGIATPNTYTAEVRGVTGSARADVVWVRSVEVGGAAVGPLPIVAHDAGVAGAEGLLGRDFLSRFSVTIDARTSVVVLDPN
jgi:hypothetical protein